MQDWVCINGVLLPAEEARVSVFDAGFMQGIGLFETMRAYHGHVFRLERHLRRMADSARKLGWTAIPDAEACSDNVMQVMQATGGEDARVRLTVTTGSLHASAADTPELTIVATAARGGKYPDECYTKGVTVTLAEMQQNPTDPTVGHKTTSYFARLASLRAAHAKAAFEALWLTPDGEIAEGAISNVFVVYNEELHTPPLNTPVLPGITRATVIELAGKLGIGVRETTVMLDDLTGADEVFLTNSMMEIVPVVRLDRTAIEREKPGEITRKLGVEYGRLIDEESGNV